MKRLKRKWQNFVCGCWLLTHSSIRRNRLERAYYETSWRRGCCPSMSAGGCRRRCREILNDRRCCWRASLVLGLGRMWRRRPWSWLAFQTGGGRSVVSVPVPVGVSPRSLAVMSVMMGKRKRMQRIAFRVLLLPKKDKNSDSALSIEIRRRRVLRADCAWNFSSEAANAHGKKCPEEQKE